LSPRSFLYHSVRSFMSSFAVWFRIGGLGVRIQSSGFRM
jgi:nitrate/nitrite transporter NarK